MPLKYFCISYICCWLELKMHTFDKKATIKQQSFRIFLSWSKCSFSNNLWIQHEKARQTDWESLSCICGHFTNSIASKTMPILNYFQHSYKWIIFVINNLLILVSSSNYKPLQYHPFFLNSNAINISRFRNTSEHWPTLLALTLQLGSGCLGNEWAISAYGMLPNTGL